MYSKVLPRLLKKHPLLGSSISTSGSLVILSKASLSVFSTTFLNSTNPGSTHLTLYLPTRRLTLNPLPLPTPPTRHPRLRQPPAAKPYLLPLRLTKRQPSTLPVCRTPIHADYPHEWLVSLRALLLSRVLAGGPGALCGCDASIVFMLKHSMACGSY